MIFDESFLQIRQILTAKAIESLFCNYLVTMRAFKG